MKKSEVKLSTSLGGNKGYGSTGSANAMNRTGQKIGGREVQQLQNFTPQQMDLFQSLFSNLGKDSYLGKLAGGDQETFNQIEKPALKQFQGFQGDLASRFSNQGLGGRNSSGFQNSMNESTENFASKLQAQRMGLQTGAIQSLHEMAGQLLGQKPYSYYGIEPDEEQSWWGKAADIGLPIIGGIAGGFSGLGPMGAAGGAQIGSSFANAINGRQGGGANWGGIGQLPSKWGV